MTRKTRPPKVHKNFLPSFGKNAHKWPLVSLSSWGARAGKRTGVGTARRRGVRFSEVLGAEYFEQLVSEKRVTRLGHGRPTTRFERIPGKRAESLDALVYATAAKAGLGLSAAAFNLLEDELRAPATSAPKPRQTVFLSRWVEEGPEPW